MNSTTSFRSSGIAPAAYLPALPRRLLVACEYLIEVEAIAVV